MVGIFAAGHNCGCHTPSISEVPSLHSLSKYVSAFTCEALGSVECVVSFNSLQCPWRLYILPPLWRGDFQKSEETFQSHETSKCWNWE